VPVPMAEASPYVAQIAESSRLVAARLGHERWSVAYQSRSGRPQDPWLEPDVGDEIRRLHAGGARDVVVAPIGFVCDHVEVLYDLDVEARGIAEACGLGFHRAVTVTDHPAFIALLADLVRDSLSPPGSDSLSPPGERVRVRGRVAAGSRPSPRPSPWEGEGAEGR
jgi:protoporphyrin/coproporphyrin ferrochelatase